MNNKEPSTDFCVLSIDDFLWHYSPSEPKAQSDEKRLVIGADEDHYWQRNLSPRHGNSNVLANRLAPFIAFLDNVKQPYPIFGVALCVEELCPGGLDASDGILIAQACEQAGASFIIASSGTSDFPALKHRRATQKKSSNDVFETNEPWLASAAWLVGRIQIPVYAKGHPHNLEHATLIAQQLGLSGLLLSTS